MRANKEKAMPERRVLRKTLRRKPGRGAPPALTDERDTGGIGAEPADAKLSETLAALGRSLLGSPDLTAVEVTALAGVDLEQTRRLWRSLGLPAVSDEARVFTSADVSILAAVRSLVDAGLTQPDHLMQMARVIGHSMSRIAEAHVAMSREHLGKLSGADSLGDPTADIVPAIEMLAPKIEPFLGYVWRRQLVAALLRVVADRPSARGQALAVGFADLVGFTAVSQRLSEPDLAAVVDRFETLAYESITARNGRIVKMIGDEVMFAIGTAEGAADAALALVEACADDEATPAVRIGLAFGPALSWEGDLLGPTVNLASRLVNIARPGTVLISDEIGKALSASARYTLRRLRRRDLKGIGRVIAWVLRRGDPQG
jgi:adenylate cyclase